jgi:glycosyltransferase involved in cell wall biosynthesis
MNNLLYIVVPCYNEEEVLNETSSKLLTKLNALIKAKKISKQSKIVFIDDGSKDSTWSIIEHLCKKNGQIMGIGLSRNCGHQNALYAGLMEAKKYCDMVISMDADLQDDIDAIDLFVSQYYKGHDIVYGVRKSRKKDSFFKRNTALFFYKLMKLMGVDIVYNHADYRLMSKRVLVELEKFREVNLFLRGLIPLLGFKSTTIYYDRKNRFAGKTKYPLNKMITFALDGITSFSIKPIKSIMTIGFSISVVSVLVLIYSIIVKIGGKTVDGWTFIVGSIWLLGGLQMFSIGVIGEYVGKIYQETKARPKYIIREVIGGEMK